MMLQSAARLVLKILSHASVTVRMRDELHWLGFPHRIIFKLCTLAYKCLHGQALDYLTRSCIPVSTVCGQSHLRSAMVGQLLTPSIHTETFGSQGFSFSCPTAWNALPDYLKHMQHVLIFPFKKHLKTHFFKMAKTMYSALFSLFNFCGLTFTARLHASPR